jgi:hopanoid biosynthesis associated protein HpnK
MIHSKQTLSVRLGGNSPEMGNDPGVGCRLIVNADDFGLCRGVNEAIAEAHDAGMLTSCSLMVAEAAFGEAVSLARARPAMGVGLHVSLLCGRAALPPAAVPALVSPDGRFGTDPFRVGLRDFFSPAARREVEAEVEAQFKRFAATGLPLSHVDAHLHFHLHPVVFAAILQAAERYGCRRIRVPLDDWSLHRRLEPADAWRQAPLALVFALLCRRMRRLIPSRRLCSPDRVLGLFRTGRLDRDYLARLARSLPDGIHELHCHPDRGTPAGRRELEALLAPEFRAALQERGAALATYEALDGEPACPHP